MPPSMFIHHVHTATALHDLRRIFNQRFGCLKTHFWSKLSSKATSIPRIIGAGLAHIGFISSFPWRPTCFCRSCMGLSKPAKYKITKLKCQSKLHLFLCGQGILYWCYVWMWWSKVVRWKAKCITDQQFLSIPKTPQHINCSTFGLS